MANNEEFQPLADMTSPRDPESMGFSLDPAYASMSKRQRKRYVKQVRRELDRQLKEARRDARGGAAQAKEVRREQARDAAEVARQIRERSKADKRRTAGQLKRRAKADNTADAIGYNLMFENGIAEVEEGFYSETLAFDDVTYQSAREDDQKTILVTMKDVLNYLDNDVTAQFSVVNTPLRDDEIASRRFYDVEAQQSETLREDAETMNDVLSEKLAQGVSNIRRARYLTIGLHAADPEEAYRRLSAINTRLTTSFEQIHCPIHPLTGTERLQAMQELLRPDQPFDFKYSDLNLARAESTRDYIAPMSMDFKPDGSTSYFKMDQTYFQALVMRKYDSPMDDNVIANLVDTQMPVCVSWYIQPLDKTESIEMVKRRRAMIDVEIINAQKKAVQEGYSYDILPSELRYSQEEADDLLVSLQGQQEHLFYFSGLILTWADDPDKLTDQVIRIMNQMRASGVTVEMLEYRQRQALSSMMPLALNRIEIARPFTSSEAAIFVPFATQELDQPGGSWYYQNKLSNNLVFGNRSTLASPVGFISGKSGSGKGFFAKNEILGTALSKPNDQIIIFDRAGEYRLLVEHLEGTYASFGVGHPAHLNPLGMEGLEHQDFGAQVSFKADAMLAQASAAAEETGTSFSDEERSIIQRSVENVFRRWKQGAGSVPEPILGDFYEELKRQPEPIAQDIALRYERYVKGFSDFFNRKTDIDLSSRIIGLNFKEVPDSMLVFALIAFCETVRFIMYKNFEAGRRTWLYIEEMESLFKYPSVLNYFRRFSNECRKFGMYLTGITQSTESMIRNQDANAIVKNSDFIVLLKQSKEDRDYWGGALGLSPAELACIDQEAKRGWGLLVFGGARIPIKGDFPTNNHLYELFSTDPNEWEEKRARGETSEAAPSGQAFRKRKRSRKRRKKEVGEGALGAVADASGPSDTAGTEA